jgi:hypothetical protein
LYAGGIPWTYLLVVAGLIIMVVFFGQRRRKRLELVRTSLDVEPSKFSYIEPQDRNDDEEDMSRESR